MVNSSVSSTLSQLSSEVSSKSKSMLPVDPPIIDHLLRDEYAMEQSANLIFYIALAILLGLFLREVNKKTKFPYSPMVLFIGMILGISQNNLGYLGESTSILGQMHPHIILFVFIPVLLFESAFNQDWFVFKKASFNILVLAGPGVCWGAILLGLVFKLLLFYGSDDMTWYQAFTLGAVLSATDPVAVVSLLKELGASTRFNTLIEGEALFNDGTAMVFFVFFCNLSKGESVGLFSTVVSLGRNCLVGPLIGVVLAFAASFWARKVVGDDVQVTWLTFVFTYITFYLCEFTFYHTSGILGVICLGLFWSAFGKTKIRQESAHAVHTVWSFIQYSADTLIFLLVGIIVGTVVIEEEYIYPSDWIKMIFFYVFMTIARYLMIMTFMPILRLHGYPISKSELIVLVYGGLRGALGLCLSLLVGVDTDLPPRFRHLTVFYMASMAAFTNLINGTTCKALVNYLNMIEEPAIKKRLFKTYLQELTVISSEKSTELASDKFFTMVDWQTVQSLTGKEKIIQNVVDLDNQLRDYSLEGRSSFEGISESETYGEVRYRYLRILKGLYYQKFEQGLTEEDSCRLLVESTNINLDQTHCILNIWELLFVSFTSFGAISYWFKIKDMMFIGRYAQHIITLHLGFIYDVTTTFIACANESMLLIQHLNVNKSAIKLVFDEIEAEINKAELYLSNLQSNFPEVLKAIQTRRASHSVLVHQRNHLEHTHDKGLVDDKEFDTLQRDVNERLVGLENHIFEWVVPTFHSIVMEFPLFSMLTQDEIQRILTNQMEKKYYPGEIIYEQGMTCQYLYIITRGNANDHLSEEVQVKRGLGSILSYANAVSSNGRCLSTCRAATECTTNAINFKVLQEIMQGNHSFEEKIFINSLDYLIRINSDRAGPLTRIDERRMNEFLRHRASFRRLEEHSKVEFPLGGYIFKGEIQSCLSEHTQSQVERYGEFSYVPPKDGEFTVTKSLVAVVFDEDASILEDEQVERFNLEEHDNEVDRLFTQSGMQQQNRRRDSDLKLEDQYLEIQDK